MSREGIAKSFLNFEEDPEVLFENIEKVPNYKKKPEDLRALYSSLKKHFTLYNLDDENLETFISLMLFSEIPENHVLFRQGDNATGFFVLRTLDVLINDEKKGKISPWECFGELALMYNCPRSATLRSSEPCAMLVLDRVNFKRALGEAVSKVIDKSRNFIDVFRLFDYFDEYQKDSLTGIMFLQKFLKYSYVFRENDQASAVFILKEGSAIIEKGKIEVRKLKIGEIFGEDSLDFDPSVYRYSVKALDNVKVFAIPAANFIYVMGERALLVRFEAQIREKLSKSKYFGKASPLTIQKIIESLVVKEYQNELVRIKSPGKLDKLWFLLIGTVTLIASPNYSKAKE